MNSSIEIFENHIIELAHGDDGTDKENVSAYRVLWRDEKKLVWINIFDNSFPQQLDIAYIKRKIESNEGSVIKNDPWQRLYDLNLDIDKKNDTVEEAEKKKKRVKIRDKRFEAIKPYITNEPEIYTEKGRGVAYKSSDCSPKQLIKYLKLYWKRGKTINALLPDFNLCGVEKDPDPHRPKNKRGPKYIKKDITGRVLTIEDYKIFDKYIKKYIDIKGMAVTSAYGLMKEKEFKFRQILNDDKKIERIQLTDNEIPSRDQFKKYYYRLKGVEAREKNKIGIKSYKMNRRAKVGAVKSRGPGYNFVIDATIIDYYVRSHYPPYNLIGQPVFYIIIDVYTRFIIGWYMGLGKPSGDAAVMALLSMASDKRKLLTALGFTDDDHIDELCMICGIPKALTIDQAELRKNLTVNLTKNLGVTISEVVAKRPDWKGVIETRFNILQNWEEMYDPSRGNYNKKKYGDPDMRLKSIKTFDEMYLDFIDLILMHNQLSISNPYLLDNLAVMEDVSPRPFELFRHGVESVGGCLRHYPEDIVKLNLLPRDSATVTPRGIKFKGLFYTPLTDNWEEILVASKPRKQAKRNPENSIEICFNNNSIDHIYIPDKNGMKYVKCTIQERCLRTVQPELEEGISSIRSNSISGFTWYEWQDFLDVQAANREDDYAIDDKIRAKYDNRLSARAENSKKATNELTKHQSNREFLAGASERKKELAEEQARANTIELSDPEDSSFVEYCNDDCNPVDDTDFEPDYSSLINEQMKNHSQK
ncbi:hypothetical protein GCM10023116_20570 [Kistimonas scapharcae]|uniref:Integrase catalytic domain-containing protein n=1 Tax=Kistimonas scapharcae TaxID=1036133 RepID=A0ABP8V3F7_9GAMM